MRFSVLLTLTVPLLVSVYTINYGRWALRNRLRFGGVMLILLGVSVTLVPGVMIWLTS